MRATSLPSPGVFQGEKLRRLAATSISSLEVVARKTERDPTNASKLEAFFAACREAVPGAAPSTELETTQVILTDGDVVTVGGTDYTVEITDNEITGFTEVV